MKHQNKILTIALLISAGIAGFYFDEASEHSEIELLAHPSNLKNSVIDKTTPTLSFSKHTDNDRDERSNQERLAPSNAFVEQLDKIINSQSEDKYKTSILIGELLTQWAEVNPADAVEWLSLIDDSSNIVDGYYYRVLQTYMKKDFHVAGNVIADLADSDRKQRLVYNYVSEFVQIDAEQALFWSDTLLEGEIKQIAKYQILNTLVYSKPNEVLDILTQDLASTIDSSLAASKEMALIASTQLDSDDFKYERSSLYQYPEEFRPQIAYGVASNWNEGDLEGAKNWIQSLAPGEAKEEALRGYHDVLNAKSNNTEEITFSRDIAN